MVNVIYYKDGCKMMRPVTSRAEYMALRESEENKRADKKHMVQMNYSLSSPLPEVGRENSAATEGIPLKGCSTPGNSVGMDVDFNFAEGTSDVDKAKKFQAVMDLILEKKEELGLLMLERSATKGFHIVFRRHPELTQEQNLRWASDLLGVEFDPGAKDITRVFFTPAGKLIYLDDRIFDPTPALPREGEGKTPSRAKNKVTPNAGNNIEPPVVSNSPSPSGEVEGGPSYNGIPYSSIIQKYWELFNEGKEPCEGNRNTLTFELAMVLRHICGFDRNLLDKIIPDYWAAGLPPTSGVARGADEKLACIDSALKEERKGMPYRLRQVLLALKKENGVKAAGGTVSTPPPMPKRLPKLIQLLTKNVPAYYKPAVSSAVFPALATHLHGVKFRYWDNVEHEATFMNVLVGRQSIGKGSIKKPIEYIMADIQERDKVSRAREAEWKRLNPPGKTKKDTRPSDICIQMLIDNLTDAVFNQRVADADQNGKRFIYTIVDEIEALKKVTSRGSTDEVMLLIRKAFDNSMHGQERVGAESVTGIAPLRWNWNASTTPPNVRRFFQKGVNDGTVGRLDISTIVIEENSLREYENDNENEKTSHKPKMEDCAPVLGIYDEHFAQDLKPYIDRLEAASGLIECPQSLKLALAMKAENQELSQLYDSEAYKVFSYRANVIAWLKGMLLYIAEGYKWDKTIADFVRWTEQYNLWCKMLYFGNQLEEELREESAIQHQSGPQNLLNLLPEEFTKDAYRQMRASQGRKGEGDSTLRTWQARGYIEWDEISHAYRKREGKEGKGKRG